MNKIFLSIFLIIVNINISFSLDLNSKFQYEDLHNNRKFAPAIPFAIPLAEGILEGLATATATAVLGNAIYQAEHTKNPRKSTEKKHQDGQARNKRDKPGGEKGDKRRPYRNRILQEININ